MCAFSHIRRSIANQPECQTKVAKQNLKKFCKTREGFVEERSTETIVMMYLIWLFGACFARPRVQHGTILNAL